MVKKYFWFSLFLIFHVLYAKPQPGNNEVCEGQFSCVPSSECRISECKGAEGADITIRSGQSNLNCATEDHVYELSFGCLDIRAGQTQEEEVCCHQTNIITNKAAPSSEIIGCQLDKEFRCVPQSECRNSQCKVEEELYIQIRSGALGLDCSSETFVSELSHDCTDIRSGGSIVDGDNICCHETNIVNVTQPEPNTDDDDGCPVDNFSCVPASQCRISSCLDQEYNITIRKGLDVLDCDKEDHVKQLPTCPKIEIRAGISSDEEEVCCHKDDTLSKEPVKPETEETCADERDYKCVPLNECSLSHCITEENSVDIRSTGFEPSQPKDCVEMSQRVEKLSQECPAKNHVCCHTMSIQTKVAELSDCSGLDGYSCVSGSQCSLTRCVTTEIEFEERSGLTEDDDFCEISSAHVQNINKTCPENIQDAVCCHQSAIIEDNRCGVKNPATVESGEWPFVCAIYKADESNNEVQDFLAGASLITPGIAMTVAHWVSGIEDPTTIFVHCGHKNLTADDKLTKKPVKWIALHPGFDESSVRNDFALLYLESEFTLSKSIRTICLPTTEKPGDEYDDDCFAAGWGKDSLSDHSSIKEVLRHIPLPLKSSEECQSALQVNYGPTFKLHGSFTCAGGQRNSDTCFGDGGGPLFCRMRNNIDQYVQVGITSWGFRCGLPNIPGVYASTHFGLCFVKFDIKCRTGLTYNDYVDLSGCEFWLQDLKEQYQKRKTELDNFIGSENSDEVKKKKAKRESEKMFTNLERIRKLETDCLSPEVGIGIRNNQ